MTAIPKIEKLFSPQTASMTGRWFASGIPEAAMEGGNRYRNAAFLPVSNAVQWGLPNTWNPISMMTDPRYAEQAQAMKEGFFGFLLPTALGVGAGMYRDNFTDAGRQRRDAERNSDKLYSLGSGDYSATENKYSGESVPSNDLRSIGSGDYSATENKYSGESVPSNELLRSWAKGEGINDQVFDLIVRESVSQGVDPRVALSVAIAESNGNQDEISPVGAIGVMQLMPETAQSLGVDPYDLEQNIHGGVKYLKQNLDAFDGDVTLAAAGYNAGTGAVQKFGGVPPYAETQNYANRVSNLFGEAANLVGDKYSYDYGGGLRGNADDDKTPIDIQAGLTSARKALDGKQMDNGTVGCVEAVTKILSHVHPEFQKMVDDGVVNTVEGENSLHSRLEKMGVEIIPFDEANVAAGDIIFYDGKQTYQHVLVADHKDADGNWRVFGNSSSANKVMEQPLYQGQTPKWIAKVSNIKGVKSSRTGNGDDTSTEAETSTDTNSIYQRLIADILNEDTKPIFDATGDDETTRSILSAFAADKRTSSAGNDFIKLSSMFDENGEFINSKANRKTLADLYGDDLVEFGQAALDERLAQLADKNSSVENLTVDDRKLLSGVLKAKLEDAGTKVGGHFLKRLNEGDADTFNKVLGSLGSVKQTALPENLSNEISRLRDEIKNLSDKAIQTSDKAEFADINKQIKAHDAKINSIQTLGKDIAKLEAELQKASDNFVKANATGNATKIATASDKVTKLQTQLDAKQAELTKIISPQVQDATPAPSKQFAPLKAQGEEAVAKRDADIREANDKIAKWTAARVEKRTSTRPSRT